MSTTSGGPNIVTSGLVLHLDAANEKSFRGIPTTNLTRNSKNFTGTTYGEGDEFSPSPYPTVLTKTYVSNLLTPVGIGATLIQESGVNGYHHLSQWGGSAESGAHSISCYVYPISTNISDFTIGMLNDGNNTIAFDLSTKQITYGADISNRNAFIVDVPNWVGWLRVGANIEGRVGGWVGSIGYSVRGAYTGTAGGRQCYITGVQYEYTTVPTPFIEAQQTRGATVATGGGWADRTANANHGELVNGPTYNAANGGRIVFDGVDDYIDLGSNLQLSNNFTLCVWHINPNTGYIIDQGNIGEDPTNSLEYTNYGLTLSANNNSSVTADGTITTTRWNFICTTFSSATTKFYINGILDSTKTASFSSFTPSGKLKIGRRAFSTSSIFSGSIGMVMIYNRVLTDSEILQNYNAQKSRFGLP